MRSRPVKATLWPMRSLKTDRTATVMVAGQVFIQNLRCGHGDSASKRDAIVFAVLQRSTNSHRV